MNDDTIAAISTPPGEGGIGIVRLSGPQSFAIARKIIFFPREIKEPESHRLYYGYVVDPKDNSSIDEALVSFMRSPRTYTREDVVEINCHGGIRPLARTLELVLSCGARLAEPGEFTQRAFLNGRLDLAQAEAVIQIIRAKTDTALRVGMNQLTGGLSSEVKKIRAQLLAVLARIEAAVDFPELHDVEEITRREIGEEVAAAGAEIEALLKTADKGKILREGLLTAIIGLPNVGKSSLLNALLREQRAIVTDVPGTTRDILEESVNIGGIALTVIDTAGIRKTENKVENRWNAPAPLCPGQIWFFWSLILRGLLRKKKCSCCSLWESGRVLLLPIRRTWLMMWKREKRLSCAGRPVEKLWQLPQYGGRGWKNWKTG